MLVRYYMDFLNRFLFLIEFRVPVVIATDLINRDKNKLEN
jgi:hypothetical protein